MRDCYMPNSKRMSQNKLNSDTRIPKNNTISLTFETFLYMFNKKCAYVYVMFVVKLLIFYLLTFKTVHTRAFTTQNTIKI